MVYSVAIDGPAGAGKRLMSVLFQRKWDTYM